MVWTIDYLRSAIAKLDTQNRQRIGRFLHQRLAKLDDPWQLGQALHGDKFGEYWRYRVGDYRIIRDVQDGELVVLVIEIGHRREIYC